MSMANFMRSPSVKAVLLLILILLLQIPFAQVRWLVQERQQRANEAQSRVSAQWSGEQTLAPALVHLRFEPNPVAKGEKKPAAFSLMVLPEKVEVKTKLIPEVRHLGIFSVPVYLAEIEVKANFSAARLKTMDSVSTHQFVNAQLGIEASDLRGVRGLENFLVNNENVEANAATGSINTLSALRVNVTEKVRQGGGLTVSYRLSLAGSNVFKILATARDTQMHMSGAWPNPGFDQGAFLPRKHLIDAKGFQADWQVLEFNRAIPSVIDLSSLDQSAVLGSAFGTRLVQQADHYQQNERIAKYGSLLLVLLFATLFLFELIGGMQLHAIQYGLIGLSLATFYVLLLALSEHLGFGRAYLIASAASITVIGGYAMAIFASRTRGFVLAVALSIAYAFFYALAAAESYALLMGAIGIFGLLSAVMFLTRKQDWRGGNANKMPPVPNDN